MHFWQVQAVHPARIFVRFSDVLMVFPIAVCDVIHADAHNLVQCRFLFYPILLPWCSILPLNREIGKLKKEKEKAEIFLVASDIF